MPIYECCGEQDGGTKNSIAAIGMNSPNWKTTQYVFGTWIEYTFRFNSIQFSFFLLLFDIARKLIHLQRLFLFSIHLALVIGTECHSVRFAIIRALFSFGWVLGGKINTRFIFHRLFLGRKATLFFDSFFLFNEKQTTND